MKHKWFVLPIILFASLAALAQSVRLLPEGSEIKVRTDTAIPAKPAANATYTASVSDDVLDKTGVVAVPRGARAQLVAVPSADGKDTTLDLRYVTVAGRRYSVTAPGQSSKGTPGGLGANTRTAKYVGGGAAIGVVLGALLGGGKGAAIGALVGGAGGAGAQVYTGRTKELPPETQLSFKLAQDLQLRPTTTRSSAMKKQP